jgi:hypothetical protein
LQSSNASNHPNDHPAGITLPAPTTSVVLRISPATGSARFSYIYIKTNKLHRKDAIMAYFDSVGRMVTLLPCPDFNSFMMEHSLANRGISFIGDLPWYIIPAGNRILEAARYNELANHDWLPAPLNLSSIGTNASPLLLSRPSGPHHFL